jgi:Protein of unknown function (DUF3168)
MMRISDAVCRRLRQDPGVSGLVGARVYQLKLPQQPTLPAVRVQLVSEPAIYHTRGVVNCYQALIQVDAFANEFDVVRPDPYDTVEQLADVIDRCLSGARFTIEPIHVTGSFRASRAPLYDPDELRLARIMQEYRITYHGAAVMGPPAVFNAGVFNPAVFQTS